MKKYGYLSAIPLSFFSAELYRDVAKNWKANVLLYLLLIVTLCSVLTTLRFEEKMIDVGKNAMKEGLLNEVLSQVPYLVIKNGEIQTPEKKPYFIKDKDGRVFMIIDTTGKYNNVKEASVDYIITSHSYFYQSKQGEQKEHLFSMPNTTTEIKIKQNGELEIDGEPSTIEKFIDSKKSIFFLVLLPFFALGAFVYRLIQAVLYSILGELFLVLSKIPLTYAQVFKLAIFALTPAVIVGVLFDFFKITFPFEGLFYFALSMAYLIFAIRTNKE